MLSIAGQVRILACRFREPWNISCPQRPAVRVGGPLMLKLFVKERRFDIVTPVSPPELGFGLLAFDTVAAGRGSVTVLALKPLRTNYERVSLGAHSEVLFACLSESGCESADSSRVRGGTRVSRVPGSRSTALNPDSSRKSGESIGLRQTLESPETPADDRSRRDAWQKNNDISVKKPVEAVGDEGSASPHVRAERRRTSFSTRQDLHPRMQSAALPPAGGVACSSFSAHYVFLEAGRDVVSMSIIRKAFPDTRFAALHADSSVSQFCMVDGEMCQCAARIHLNISSPIGLISHSHTFICYSADTVQFTSMRNPARACRKSLPGIRWAHLQRDDVLYLVTETPFLGNDARDYSSGGHSTDASMNSASPAEPVLCCAFHVYAIPLDSEGMPRSPLGAVPLEKRKEEPTKVSSIFLPRDDGIRMGAREETSFSQKSVLKDIWESLFSLSRQAGSQRKQDPDEPRPQPLPTFHAHGEDLFFAGAAGVWKAPGALCYTPPVVTKSRLGRGQAPGTAEVEEVRAISLAPTYTGGFFSGIHGFPISARMVSAEQAPAVSESPFAYLRCRNESCLLEALRGYSSELGGCKEAPAFPAALPTQKTEVTLYLDRFSAHLCDVEAVYNSMLLTSANSLVLVGDSVELYALDRDPAFSISYLMQANIDKEQYLAAAASLRSFVPNPLAAFQDSLKAVFGDSCDGHTPSFSLAEIIRVIDLFFYASRSGEVETFSEEVLLGLLETLKTVSMAPSDLDTVYQFLLSCAADSASPIVVMRILLVILDLAVLHPSGAETREEYVVPAFSLKDLPGAFTTDPISLPLSYVGQILAQSPVLRRSGVFLSCYSSTAEGGGGLLREAEAQLEGEFLRLLDLFCQKVCDSGNADILVTLLCWLGNYYALLGTGYIIRCYRPGPKVLAELLGTVKNMGCFSSPLLPRYDVSSFLLWRDAFLSADSETQLQELLQACGDEYGPVAGGIHPASARACLATALMAAEAGRVNEAGEQSPEPPERRRTDGIANMARRLMSLVSGEWPGALDDLQYHLLGSNPAAAFPAEVLSSDNVKDHEQLVFHVNDPVLGFVFKVRHSLPQASAGAEGEWRDEMAQSDTQQCGRKSGRESAGEEVPIASLKPGDSSPQLGQIGNDGPLSPESGMHQTDRLLNVLWELLEDALSLSREGIDAKLDVDCESCDEELSRVGEHGIASQAAEDPSLDFFRFVFHAALSGPKELRQAAARVVTECCFSGKPETSAVSSETVPGSRKSSDRLSEGGTVDFPRTTLPAPEDAQSRNLKLVTQLRPYIISILQVGDELALELTDLLEESVVTTLLSEYFTSR